MANIQLPGLPFVALIRRSCEGADERLSGDDFRGGVEGRGGNKGPIRNPPPCQPARRNISFLVNSGPPLRTALSVPSGPRSNCGPSGGCPSPPTPPPLGAPSSRMPPPPKSPHPLSLALNVVGLGLVNHRGDACFDTTPPV